MRCNPVWMYLIAPALSLLPRRWRESLHSSLSMPWVPATIISGCVEAACGLAGLVYWYSYSVTGWVQKSLDTQLKAHPGAAIPVGTEGFVGLLLVAANPLTWVIVAYLSLIKSSRSLWTERAVRKTQGIRYAPRARPSFL